MSKKSAMFMMCILLLFFINTVHAASNVHVTDAGNTWFTVVFSTSAETSGKIYYGTDFYSLSNSFAFPSSKQHVVNITSLLPNTLYYFDIQEGEHIDNNKGKHYRFVTNIGSGKTYFLSNNGSDSNNGSYYAPWKTIAHAKSVLKPGDTLLIMDGIYKGAGENVGIVFFQYGTNPRYQVSGEPGNPITYRAYNKGYGIHPIFDAEFSQDVCSDYHCDVFKTVYAHDIVFDSLWVRNVDNHLSESGGFIQRYSDRIDFIDCYVSNIIGGDRGELSCAFCFCGTHNSSVAGARAWNLHGSSVQNKGAVNIYYGAGSNRYSVNITTIMSEFWDADAGAQVKSWGQKDAVFEDNFFHDIERGIHDIGANTLVRENIIYNATIAHSTLNDYYHDPSQRPVIEHNTFVDFDKGTEFADWHYPVVEVDRFNDNILYSERESCTVVHDTYYPGCQQNDKSECPPPYNEIGSQANFHDSDYNIFYTPSETDIIEYMGERMNLTAYKQTSGYDIHSMQKDPLLINISARDFRLSSLSPAKSLSPDGYIGAIDPAEEIGRIEIHPLFINIEPGEEYLFVVKVFDKSGKEIPPGHFPVEWKCMSGEIDKNGLYKRTSSSPDTVMVNVSGFTDYVRIGDFPDTVCEASPFHYCYYVAPWGNDSNDGSFERPFRTVQHGFDVISPGDYLYLRGGIYREHVEIRPYNKPQGNPSEWYTVKSYPGEWAVLNPEYNSPCPVIFYGSDSCGTHGSHGYDFCPQYWRFEHFEVTGGGTDYSDRGGGIDFDTAANIVFDHLYIHDNMGSSSSNNGGIVIRNDADAASNITIQHCYLKNNACSDLHNCGNIVLFSDYVENPRNVKISSALSNNTIRYNLIEGSAVGLKYKNSQWLSLDHTGNDIRYATHGDRVYRNIFSGQGNSAILGGQDFIQIYENIFNSSKSVSLGEAYGEDREPFYACFYNNLLINTRLNLAHDDDNAGDGSSYSAPLNEPDYHPHVYIYNNIIEDAGPETNAHNDINIFFTWTKDYQDYLNMSTVYMENNLFVPRTRTEEVINIGDNDNDYSIEEYISRGYSSTLYNSETVSGLHAEGTYKINMQFMLNDSCFIYNCGKGGSHPYLQGVSIPSYIGPCPGSECSWVDDVLALSDITALIEGGQENEKFSPADTNRNGKIELVELIEFIKKWKSNEINTMDLINAIKSWKEKK